MINSKRQQKRKRQRKCNNIDYYNNQEKQCEIENNNTFYKIVQNIAIKKSQTSINEQNSNLESFNFEVHGFFYQFKDEKDNLVKLYDYLNNKFISEISLKIIVNNFCKVKRTYNALKMFETICYWKYSCKYKNDEDLCMNPLNKFSKRSLIQINQNKTIYTFRISDLLKHINSNLLFTTNYIHEPKLSKNPYNNLNFGHHDYYNIYFQAKQSDYIIPPLYHLLFLENLNIKKFTVNNYPYIRDKFILSEYISFSPTKKSKQIRKMIANNKNLISPKIDATFPIDILNESLGHVLLDYLYFRYSINDQKLQESTNNYQKKLVNFFRFNPRFGRKKLIRTYLQKQKYQIQYESLYPTISQLKTLCNNDTKIYDEAPDHHYYDSDSDSDSVMSNELANNEPEVYPPTTRINVNGDVSGNSDNIDPIIHGMNSYGINISDMNTSDMNTIVQQIETSISNFADSHTFVPYTTSLFNYQDAIAMLPQVNRDDISRYTQLLTLDLSNSIIEDIEVAQLHNELINDYYENESYSDSDNNNETDED